MTFQYHCCPVLVSEGALPFSTVTYNWCSLCSSTFSPSLLCLAPLTSLNLCTTCKSLEKNLPVLPTSTQKGRGGTCKGVIIMSVLGEQINWCDTVWAILPCEVSLFSLRYIQEMVWISGTLIIGEIHVRSTFCFLRNPAHFYLWLQRQNVAIVCSHWSMLWVTTANTLLRCDKIAAY